MNPFVPNLFPFAFVDPSMFFSTMTLKYGRHFADNDQPRHFFEPPYHDCQHIVLRGPGDGDWSADGDHIDYPLLQEWPSAQQFLVNIGAQITTHLAVENLTIGKAYVESIRPGGFVCWQIDSGPYAKVHERYRVLASPCAGGCWFSGGESLGPGTGNLTYFNTRVLNSAINLGPVPQISMIVDVRRPALQ